MAAAAAASDSRASTAWVAVQGQVNRKVSCDVAWKTALVAAADAVDRTEDAELLRKLSRDGNAEELRHELKQWPNAPLLVNVLDEDGMSALHLAIKHGHTDCVRILLAHGADLEAIERESDMTPLLIATKLEHIEVTRLLIEFRASLSARDQQGATPLVWAARNNQPESIDLLLSTAKAQADERHDVLEDEPLVSALRIALRNASSDSSSASSSASDSIGVLLKYLGELVLPGDLADVIEDDDQRRLALRALLSAYSHLTPEALARCVARAFKVCSDDG